MLFGLNRATDEQSLQEVLEQFSSKELTQVLIPRLSDGEINQLADLLMELMRTHFSDQEYHQLFLNDPHHHH
ncbi:hypothetical protein [Desulfogranum mediterraneum]|uniref:hypothetical protein n=1 Tax=Desulfogranum mediterraneum TaxID=160661 RepID=UPI000408C500|nr:hypothetical protein [Desulfogranum mediterraneum]